MLIPQCSPKANYLARKEEIDAAIAKVLAGGSYILGGEVAAFEKDFAAYIGVANAVGVASGTDALQLALRAGGVGAGDCVITVSHTAVATVAAIELTGATPILADIDPLSFTIIQARLPGFPTHQPDQGEQRNNLGEPEFASRIQERKRFCV